MTRASTGAWMLGPKWLCFFPPSHLFLSYCFHLIERSGLCSYKNFIYSCLKLSPFTRNGENTTACIWNSNLTGHKYTFGLCVSITYKSKKKKCSNAQFEPKIYEHKVLAGCQLESNFKWKSLKFVRWDELICKYVNQIDCWQSETSFNQDTHEYVRSGCLSTVN